MTGILFMILALEKSTELIIFLVLNIHVTMLKREMNIRMKQ